MVQTSAPLGTRLPRSPVWRQHRGQHQERDVRGVNACLLACQRNALEGNLSGRRTYGKIRGLIYRHESGNERVFCRYCVLHQAPSARYTRRPLINRKPCHNAVVCNVLDKWIQSEETTAAARSGLSKTPSVSDNGVSHNKLMKNINRLISGRGELRCARFSRKTGRSRAFQRQPGHHPDTFGMKVKALPLPDGIERTNPIGEDTS